MAACISCLSFDLLQFPAESSCAEYCRVALFQRGEQYLDFAFPYRQQIKVHRFYDRLVYQVSGFGKSSEQYYSFRGAERHEIGKCFAEYAPRECEYVLCKLIPLYGGIEYIFRHAAELQVNTAGYSVWGSSAGARMAAYIGSYGTAAFGAAELPRPRTVVMAYTGHSEYTRQDPPTYAVVGSNDGIANPNTMRRRTEALQAIGIPAEFHLYPNLRHGFGLGIGTSAEGWIDGAVRFWEANR